MRISYFWDRTWKFHFGSLYYASIYFEFPNEFLHLKIKAVELRAFYSEDANTTLSSNQGIRNDFRISA